MIYVIVEQNEFESNLIGWSDRDKWVHDFLDDGTLYTMMC